MFEMSFWIPIITAVLFFVAALCAFFLISFGVKRLCKTHAGAKKIYLFVKVPLLFLFFEIAAILALRVLKPPFEIVELIDHVLSVVIIGTIGWGIVLLAKGIYLSQIEEFEKSFQKGKQSKVLQLQFIYRSVAVVVFFLTAAAIFSTFPSVKSIGVAALSSAGIMGIAVGIAARPIILNYIAGFYIGFSKFLKVGDVITFSGERGRVEHIYLTHAVIKTWDWKRHVVPLSKFVEDSFENLSLIKEDMVAVAFVHCDFATPIEALREEFDRLLESSSLWTKEMKHFFVIEAGSHAMQIRLTASAKAPFEAFQLKCFLQEKMVAFLQKNYPLSLPRHRYDNRDVN